MKSLHRYIQLGDFILSLHHNIAEAFVPYISEFVRRCD